MFIPTSVQSPRSPRARELSERLQTVIHDYQRQFPLTPAEIRQALHDAASTTAGSGTSRMSAEARIIFWLAVIGLPIVLSATVRALR